MEEVRIAVIGGSGLYQMAGLNEVKEYEMSTPFGDPSSPIVVGTLSGDRIAFLARHGRGHPSIPSDVPYHANIYALKSMGVEQIVAVSACGSLREHLKPGEFVVPAQVYDNTKLRRSTFFGDGLAAHISVADPFCPRMQNALAEAIGQAGGTVHRGGRLVTIEGPRFSTKGESHTFRQWGMDLVNMTTCPEAFLAREAEICYGLVNAISDYDVWHQSEEPVTVEMVIEILKSNAALAQAAIEIVIPALVQEERDCECGSVLGQALITQPDAIPTETLEKLGPLVKRHLGGE